MKIENMIFQCLNSGRIALNQPFYQLSCISKIGKGPKMIQGNAKAIGLSRIASVDFSY